MQVFLSHAAQDKDAARLLAMKLRAAGIVVWRRGDEIYPGDNWAKKIGEALEQSEQMIVLLAAGSFAASDSLRHEVEYALGSLNYRDRVVTVFVGPRESVENEVPWVLRLLPVVQLESLDEATAVDQVVEQIATLQK